MSILVVTVILLYLFCSFQTHLPCEHEQNTPLSVLNGWLTNSLAPLPLGALYCLLSFPFCSSLTGPSLWALPWFGITDSLTFLGKIDTFEVMEMGKKGGWRRKWEGRKLSWQPQGLRRWAGGGGHSVNTGNTRIYTCIHQRRICFQDVYNPIVRKT